MKLIFDSNAYKETKYTRSAKYEALLSFLRRANSHIALLESVRDETVALFERELTDGLETINKEIDGLRRNYMLTLSHRLSPALDMDVEIDRLRQELLATRKGVTVELVKSVVDLQEVVRRGSRRIPPANSKGEELRDVIHWLATLSFATTQHCKIVFVTTDKGFWNNIESLELREQINEDIRTSGLDIEMFPNIESLLRVHALSTVSLDNTTVSKFFSDVELTPLLLEALTQWWKDQNMGVSLESADVSKIEFKSGTKYETSASSQFIEATYAFEGEMRVLISPHGLRQLLPKRPLTLADLDPTPSPIAGKLKATMIVSRRVEGEASSKLELESLELDLS